MQTIHKHNCEEISIHKNNNKRCVCVHVITWKTESQQNGTSGMTETEWQRKFVLTCDYATSVEIVLLFVCSSIIIYLAFLLLLPDDDADDDDAANGFGLLVCVFVWNYVRSDA